MIFGQMLQYVCSSHRLALISARLETKAKASSTKLPNLREKWQLGQPRKSIVVHISLICWALSCAPCKVLADMVCLPDTFTLSICPGCEQYVRPGQSR